MQTIGVVGRLKAEEGNRMNLMAFFHYHTHYWGVPHPRETDNKLIQTCYECGAEREVKIELRQSQEPVAAPYQNDNLLA
jgi:hypothetical protein